eukprot:535634_1
MTTISTMVILYYLIPLISGRSFIGFNGLGFNAFHKSTQKNTNAPISSTNVPTPNTNPPTLNPILIPNDRHESSKRPKIYHTNRPTFNKHTPSPTKKTNIISQYSYNPFGKHTSLPTDTISETNIATSNPTNFISEDYTTIHPTVIPSANPTNNPSKDPTHTPMRKSAKKPSKYGQQWKFKPVTHPTKKPTFRPINNPSKEPTSNPSSVPTEIPTDIPTQNPTMSPTNRPTHAPIRDICPYEYRQGQSFD